MNALKDTGVKNLSDLILDLDRDKNLKRIAFSITNPEIPNDVKDVISGIGLPLRLFEPMDYRQSIFSEDEVKTKNYVDLFRQAIVLDKMGKKNEALILFQKCVSINPNDAHATGSLANTLADMELYENAFLIFAKALELAPNDPWIARNFAVALMEFERFYDSLSLLLRMFEKFPLIGDLHFLFDHNFKQCIKHRLLTNEQVLELQTKWDSLK